MLKTIYLSVKLIDHEKDNFNTKNMIDFFKTTRRFFPAMLVLVIVSLGLTTNGCERLEVDNPDNGNNISPLSIFYIVGYDVNCGVEIQDSTAKAKGYVLVSENLIDTLVAYNLPDSLFAFPSDIMPQNVFGFNLFPQGYRFTYKVQMTYRLMTEEEWREALCPAICLNTRVFFFEPTYIVIASISKN